MWAVKKGVSPYFLRAALVFCVPSPPNLNATAKDDPSYLVGIGLCSGESAAHKPVVLVRGQFASLHRCPIG